MGLSALPFIFFCGLVIIFLFLLLTPRDKTELPSALIGLPPPIFDLAPLPEFSPITGLTHNDLELGHLYLVNIFASWCVPCRLEHPNLMELARRGDVKVVGINYKDAPANAREFLASLGNPYERIGIDPKGRVALEWGVYGIPETFLIDKDGLIHMKIVGPLVEEKYDSLRLTISELLAR